MSVQQEAFGIGQRVEQLVEQVPQVGAGLGFGGVGPEEERQVPARLGRVAMEDQVGQQGLQARGIHGADIEATISQTELTQHLDTQLRWHALLQQDDGPSRDNAEHKALCYNCLRLISHTDISR